MNAFALPGRTNENAINTQGVASLALGYALVGLSACQLSLPLAMRSLGFAMHYWLHLSNSSMLDCIRFERSFCPFETKSETLVIRNIRAIRWQNKKALLSSRTAEPGKSQIFN